MLYALSTVIRLRREYLKLSIWTLASRAHMHPRFLTRLELAECDIDVLSLQKLASALGASSSELLNVAEKLQSVTSVSKRRLSLRVRSRRQLQRLLEQNARLLQQLEVMSDPSGSASQNKYLSRRELLLQQQRRLMQAKAHQDERERFLLRFLDGKCEIRHVLGGRPNGFN